MAAGAADSQVPLGILGAPQYYMQTLFKAIRPGDIIALLFSLAATAVFSVFLYGQGSGKPQVRIETPQGKFVYSLAQERTVDAVGPLGTSHIRISHGSVAFVDSPCANQLCVHTGAISRGGTWAACLPNRILVRVTGQAEAGVDASTW